MEYRSFEELDVRTGKNQEKYSNIFEVLLENHLQN